MCPKGVCPKSWPSAMASARSFVEVEGARDCAGDLADFEGVGEAGYIVVAERCDEDLRFVFESSEGFAVYDAVAVALILGADVGGSLRDGSSGGTAGFGCVG